MSDHFTYKRLLKFVIPSITMMVFASIYGVMDGLFVSNFVGKTSFAAINIILPLIVGLDSFGLMMGSGGAALVAKTLGEGNKEKANQIFSMLLAVTILIGIVLTVFGLLMIRPLAVAMGAAGDLLENCILYGYIILSLETTFLLQCVFQSIFPVAEKPKLGFMITVTAGVVDILLNALLIIVFRWGIAGAALSTIIGHTIGGIIPIFYFARKNDSLLRLVKPTFHLKEVLKVCTNGSSEMMTGLSASVVGVLFNLQLIKFLGENGVAAYGVIMYVYYVFNALFIGYSMGCAPVISYHYGAGNHQELKNLFLKSLTLVGVCSTILTFLSVVFALPIVKIYLGYDIALLELAYHAFKIFALSFLFSGVNIFASAFFTALNNGLVSAMLSFSRTLIFQTLMILILPAFMGINGIWLAVGSAELMAFSMTIIFFIKKNKEYHYAN